MRDALKHLQPEHNLAALPHMPQGLPPRPAAPAMPALPPQLAVQRAIFLRFNPKGVPRLPYEGADPTGQWAIEAVAEVKSIVLLELRSELHKRGAELSLGNDTEWNVPAVFMDSLVAALLVNHNHKSPFVAQLRGVLSSYREAARPWSSRGRVPERFGEDLRGSSSTPSCP